jgi:hypothetical protein
MKYKKHTSQVNKGTQLTSGTSWEDTRIPSRVEKQTTTSSLHIITRNASKHARTGGETRTGGEML